MLRSAILLVLAVLLACAAFAVARDNGRPQTSAIAERARALSPRTPLLGAYRAEVLRVLDGDTLEVRVHVWMGQEVVTRVRLAAIDAPELGGTCPGEREAALRARDRLAELAAPGVVLAEIRPDKYFGRVGAEVRGLDGRLLGAMLVAEGLAREQQGRRREGWCRR
jgi:endonuclease YncB( thermonuclease family)